MSEGGVRVRKLRGGYVEGEGESRGGGSGEEGGVKRKIRESGMG